MSSSVFARIHLSFVFGGALVAFGCVSQPRSKESSTAPSTSKVAEATSAQPKPKAKPAAEPVVARESSAPKPKAAAAFASAQLAFPTGDVATSAILLEKNAPAEVAVGQVFDYRMRVTNLTNQVLENVSVTDKLPGGFEFKDAEPATTAMADDTGRWSLGALKPNETRDITIRGIAKGTGLLSTCSEVTYNTSMCLTTKVVDPKIKLLVSAPADVLICEKIPVRYVVSNTGTGSANNVVVKGTLPAGLALQDGKTNFSQDVGTLAAGQSSEFVLQAEAKKTGKFEHTGKAAADGNLAAEAARAETLVREPVLKLTHTGTQKLFAGGRLNYEITVTNTGDGIARNLILVDSPAQGYKFVSASEGGKQVGDRIKWQLGDLAPQATRKLTVSFLCEKLGVGRSIASAEADCAAPVSAPIETEIRGIPAVLLEVVDLSDPIRVGENETYVIRVTNQGSAMDTNVKISCTLPKELECLSSTGATAGNTSGETITFTPLAKLEPKQVVEWKVVVRAKSPGDVRFKVVLTSDQLTTPVEESEATYLYE